MVGHISFSRVRAMPMSNVPFLILVSSKTVCVSRSVSLTPQSLCLRSLVALHLLQSVAEFKKIAAKYCRTLHGTLQRLLTRQRVLVDRLVGHAKDEEVFANGTL